MRARPRGQARGCPGTARHVAAAGAAAARDRVGLGRRCRHRRRVMRVHVVFRCMHRFQPRRRAHRVRPIAGPRLHAARAHGLRDGLHGHAAGEQDREEAEKGETHGDD